MLYNLITKNENQLKKENYLKGNNWFKSEDDKLGITHSFLRKSEIGETYKDMKKLKYGFENIHTGDYIPDWAVHRFLDKEKDSMYFI